MTKQYLIDYINRQKKLYPALTFTIKLVNDSHIKEYECKIKAPKLFNKENFDFSYEGSIADILDTLAYEIEKAKDFQYETCECSICGRIHRKDRCPLDY